MYPRYMTGHTWGIDLSKEEVEEKEEKIVSWKNKLKK